MTEIIFRAFSVRYAGLAESCEEITHRAIDFEYNGRICDLLVILFGVLDLYHGAIQNDAV